MSESFNNLNTFLGDYFNLSIPHFHIIDGVEIVLIAMFFYMILVWIKDTRAYMLLRGIIIVVVFFIVAALLQMNTILWLGEKLVSAGLIALIVVFQPELRAALERLGRSNWMNRLIPVVAGKDVGKRFSDRTLHDLVKASYEMGAVKTGALIVVEKEVQLTEYERTGIEVDALLSRQLLINIFEKNTPLHDGAIIVRGDRVVSATCYLPLTDRNDVNKELGTRHRAGLGISENTDSMTIIVSEETGAVSVAYRGQLVRNLNDDSLRKQLELLQDKQLEPRRRRWKKGGQSVGTEARREKPGEGRKRS